MERYEFQFLLGRELSRLVLENRLDEIKSLPKKFESNKEQARKMILAYLGALSFDERIEDAQPAACGQPAALRRHAGVRQQFYGCPWQ